MDDIFSVSIEAIKSFHDGTSSAYQSKGFLPSEESQADHELATTRSREQLETAFSLGSMLIEVAADQAMAFTKTISIPAQTIAPWTTARSVIESAALGSWLMDDAIGSNERIMRGFAFRYEGLSQQEKFSRAENHGTVTDAVVERINAVESKAVELGYARILSKKNNKRIGIGQIMPSVTDIIDKALNMQGTYRLLSAAAHGHFWALNHLSFQPVLNNQTPLVMETAAGVKVHVLQKALHPNQALFLTAEILASLAHIVWRKFKLFGWDLKGIELVFDSAYDKIGIKSDAQKFWK